MSTEKDGPELDDCEFEWGKKRGRGGRKKEVQFYESFTWDGVEYSLYDCVYLYKDDEPEPYVGKLIKIWEQPDKKRRMKVLWFFRPIEILNYLREGEALENELFLACGEGTGLANVNPVEVIAGKCNVVCTSKDSRNPQPSEEELKMADFIFYRTFNVSTFAISDKIEDKIATVEVNFIYNRNGGTKATDTSKCDNNSKKENEVVGCSEVSQPAVKLNAGVVPQDSTRLGKVDNSLAKEDEKLTTPSVKKDILREPKESATHVVKHENSLPEKARSIPVNDCGESGGKAVKVSDGQVANEEKRKSANNLNGSDRPSKKVRIDNSAKSSKELDSTTSTPLSFNKEKKEAIVKKKLRVDSDEDDTAVSEDKKTPKVAGNSLVQDKAPTKKIKINGDKGKLTNGQLSKPAASHGAEKDIVKEGQTMEVSRRPVADRSKWFKGLPWEERIDAAHDQGTLVLLENLDPTYTSSEVEDIIWHAFKEICSAKIIQKTAISSPHSGQAFAIFKTRDAAETAISKLDEECLMLPNGRPLVASSGTPPKLNGKPSTSLVGHLFIDKVKLQAMREKRAVSTSHCSQPNTVEYEMAMEWCLLQKRSDRWWKDLYKQHGDELRKVQANLKSK